jgi:hypothetical protein
MSAARRRSRTPDPSRHPACARCGQCYQVGARWPEGPVCEYCYWKARLLEGVCDHCGCHGATPGLNAAKKPICLRCSGIPVHQSCRRCDTPGWLGRDGCCWRCVLTELVTDLLTGPEGHIPDHLRPLAEGICGMRRPQSGFSWLHKNPQARQLLQDLASGTLACDHAALDERFPSRTLDHLRGLMVTYGVLPPRDRRLAAFTRMITTKLSAIPDDDQRRVVKRFARWNLLRSLREHATHGPVPQGPFLAAKQVLTLTIEFLTWLKARGRSLGECTQHDIDAWFATGTSTRQNAHRFLRWAQSHRLIHNIDIPNPTKENPHLISQQQRLEIIRSLLLDEHLALPDRIIGYLITLFGQPIHRVTELRVNQVQETQTGIRIQLGRHWIDAPEPLAALLRTHLATRLDRGTAANPTSPWLFPGLLPGEHRSSRQAGDILRAAGIPVRALRNTTWQQLLREAPPQVLADALGIHPSTVMRHATQAGADWTTYAANRAQKTL